MVNVGIIGVGYWGPNLLRNFMSLRKAVRIVGVCDADAGRLKRMAEDYPGIIVEKNLEKFLERTDLDAVAIALPAALHGAVGLQALRAGKHVFMEKPLAMSSMEAERLIEAARQAKRVLMVGHTFLYNAAVRKIKEYIDAGQLGDVFYIQAQRLNLGKVRQDVNVMWNLAPHDISIILYLLDEMPDWVSATGSCFVQKDIEDVAFLTLHFHGGRLAQIHNSWLDPGKIRRMTIVGSKKMVTYDDTSADSRIVIHDKGIALMKDVRKLEEFRSFGEFQLLTRSGDVVIPRIAFEEPLKEECRHFLECIEKGKTPLTDGESGLKVLRVLESATRSMRAYGKPVYLKD